MRHSAVHFASKVNEYIHKSDKWDLLFCSDMLNLAEFHGLVNPSIRLLPSVIYFHENQLTYPNRFYQERDLQFAFTNFTSCLSANRIWFNSEYHRASYLDKMYVFLKNMPDYQPLQYIESIRSKSDVLHPGIPHCKKRSKRHKGPLQILWAARWEHDKNPECFFKAIRLLTQRTSTFRINILGEQFEQSPTCFAHAKREFAEYIDLFGYQESRGEYETALEKADVIVSTADHEFFGLAVVEAVSAGAKPLLPHRLSYPELFKGDNWQDCFYDGSPEQLADRLFTLAKQIEADGYLHNFDIDQAYEDISRFFWPNLADQADTNLMKIVESVKH